MNLPADPDEALALLTLKSKSAPILVFKFSPICPISTRAESECRAFLESLEAEPDLPKLEVAWIDVIAERTLARGLTARLGIEHQSPQALLWQDGELVWNESHTMLQRKNFAAHVLPGLRRKGDTFGEGIPLR